MRAFLDLKRTRVTPSDPIAQLEATCERVLRLIDEILAQPLRPEDRARVAALWTVPVHVGRLAANWPEDAPLEVVAEGSPDG